MYRIGFFLIAVLAIALGLLIGTLNSEPTTVDLLWVQLDWPLGLFILTVFALGFLLGLLLIWVFGMMPLKSRLRRQRSQEGGAPGSALKRPNG